MNAEAKRRRAERTLWVKNTTFVPRLYLDRYEFGQWAGHTAISFGALAEKAVAEGVTLNRAAYRFFREKGFGHVQSNKAAAAVSRGRT